ncbi:MAG: NAD(P)H-binding protein, partial [Chloroflexi bacterium]|nr:NAD(P)H-binding protein [Chloroflexota bacterium]
VTGATGFVGRSLMAYLAREEIEARVYNGRINNPLSLREALVGVDTVIHLATAESQGRARLLDHVDVEGTERMVEEGERANIKRFVFVSRIGADPMSIHDLLKAKGKAERIIQSSGIPYTILRSTTLFGHGDRFLEMIAGLAIWSWPFVWLPGGGKMALQPLWVEDLVRCIVSAIDRPDMENKHIVVAGEERIHYRDLVQQILIMIGVRRFPLPLPLVLLRPLTALFFRWWYWPAVSSYFVARFFVPELAQIDTVQHHFGFRPIRLNRAIAYLNRGGLALRIFRR